MKRKILTLRIAVYSVIILSVGLLAFSTTLAMVEEEETNNQVSASPQAPGELGMPGSPQASPEPQYAPGEIVIKLRDGSTLADIQELNQKYGVTSTDQVFQTFLEAQKKQKEASPGTTTEKHEPWYWQMDKDSKEAKEYQERLAQEKEAQDKTTAATPVNQAQSQTTLQDLDLSKLENIYTLKVAENTNLQQMLQDYKNNPAVEEATPNYQRKIEAFPQTLPNDTYVNPSGDGVTWHTGAWSQTYEDMWGLKKIQADQAWKISQGEGVIVAVVDTGIDYNHEDIAENIWTNTDEIPDNGIDDDNNGFIDDVRGWDFASNDSDPMDGHGHGTHVAGTIAAVGNNGKGIIGVAPKAKVMALKGLDDKGRGHDTNLAQAILYAAANGADVVNMSWGGAGECPPTLKAALETAYTQGRVGKGTVLVAAAGNEKADAARHHPANSPYVITVAAFDHNDQRSDFSNYGVKIDVAAPGGDSTDEADTSKKYRNILSLLAEGTDIYKDSACIIEERYYRTRGTSMAAPHVSGLTTSVLSKYPALSAEEARQAIRISADDTGRAGWDSDSGCGRINAVRALQGGSVCVAFIAAPTLNAVVNGVVEIYGIATGGDFKSYSLEYSTDLIIWTLFYRGTSRIQGAKLGELDTTTLSEGRKYIRLKVVDKNNREFYSQISIRIKNLEISRPFYYDLFRSGEVIEIRGTVTAHPFDHYEIQYAQEQSDWTSVGITLVNNTDGKLNETLGYWDTAGLSEGDYWLKLIVYRQGGVESDIVKLISLATTLKDNFPLRIDYNRKMEDYDVPFKCAAQYLVTDINRDGLKEIVVAVWGMPGRIFVYNADGTLRQGWPREIYPADENAVTVFPTSIAVGDINGDNQEEIMVAIQEWIPKGSGAFFIERAYMLGLGDSGSDVFPPISGIFPIILITDLDCDGIQEIVAQKSYPTSIDIYQSNGNLRARVDVHRLGNSWWRWPSLTMAAGDLDRDNRPEIVRASATVDSDGKHTAWLYVVKWDGVQFTPLLEKGFPGYDAASVTLGDVNGDGALEIVLRLSENLDKGKIFVLDKGGNELGSGIETQGASASENSLGDLDGDNELEIVENKNLLHPDGDDTTNIWRWTGERITSLSTKFYNQSALLADLDNDGRVDILGSSDTSSSTIIKAKTMDGQDITGFTKRHQSTPFAPFLGDIDNDSKMEMVSLAVSFALNIPYGDPEPFNAVHIFVWDLDAPYDPAKTPWPMFRHDPQYTGNHNYTPPFATLKLQKLDGTDSETTNSRTVEIDTVNPSETPVKMKFSTTSKSSGFGPEIPYANHYDAVMILSKGVGLKTVWAKYQDAAGNWTPDTTEIKDTITLADTTAPSNPTVIGYTDSTKAYTLTSGAWDKFPTPYFEWTEPTDDISGIAGYYVYFGTSSTGTPATWQTTRNYTASGLTSGNTYYFRIKTKDSAGNISSPQTKFTYKFDNVVTNPATISGYNSSAKTVSLTSGNWYSYSGPYFEWAAPADSSGIKGYYLYFGTSSTGTPTTWQTTRNYTASGLTSGQTYYLRIMTQDNAYNISTAETKFTYKFDSSIPSTPAVSDGTDWTSYNTIVANYSAVDLESGIAEYKYRVTRDSVTGTEVVPWTSNGTNTRITLNGLMSQGGRYYVGVQARNGAGQWSATGYSDGLLYDNTAPSTPVVTDGGSSTTSTTQLSASWVSTDPESGLQWNQYKITEGTVSGTIIKNWTSVGLNTSVTATGLSLQRGKTYYFSVQTRNCAGLNSSVGYSDGILVQ